MIELDAPARASRLATLGSTDPELRGVVESLLAADAEVVADPDALETRLFSPLPDALHGIGSGTVSHFRVGEPLGAGGMGLVYRAEDTRLGRAVALKFPRPHLSLDGDGRSRFLREARAAATLDHPNLCTIYEVGEIEDGRLFIAMALYTGETIKARLARNGPLSVNEALAITRQIAAGLACAHEAGIIHRDLKPGNVMLLPDGTVKILDFGLAKDRNERASTSRGFGTVAYMSPEQILGNVVEARADLWAVGVVLYEMLTGQKPFRGEHEVAIADAIVHDEPAAPTTLRAELPADVEQVVLALLQKDRRAGYATMNELMADLAAIATRASRPRVNRPRRVPRLWATSLVAALAIGAVWAARLSWRASPGSLDANLLAVAPFNAHGASLGSWREGLVEYLSRSVDGAGDIRTVSPSIFLRRWSGGADPASARALGRHTGAGLVVFGSVVQGAGDSVRVRATLLDVAGDRSLAEVEFRGDTSGIDRAADSIGIALLRELGRGPTRPVDAARNLPFGTASLPALKEFLKGERFYRRSLYDSALAHHARAIALDSTFALAYRRLSLEVGWNPPTSGSLRSVDAYARRAAALNHGLGLRDSLLIAADSWFWADGKDGPSLNHRRRLFTTLTEAARRFPGDPEVWQAIGEGLEHTDTVATRAEVLQAFDKAIALDSGFAPAYEHVLQQAIWIGGTDLARRYAAAYRTLNTQDANSASIRLAAMLLDPVLARSPDVARFVDTADISTLFRVGLEHVGPWADSGETAIRLLRALSVGRRSSAGAEDWVADSLMWPQYVAAFLLYRGHAREAYRVYRSRIDRPNPHPWAWFVNPLVDLALVHAIPVDTVNAIIARSAGTRSWQRWLPWWFTRRDTAALERAIEHAGRLTINATDSVGRARARSEQSAAIAYLDLVRGDSVAAIRAFRAIPDAPCHCPFERFALAQLLAHRNDREAGEIIDRWLWVGPSPLFVLARLERARIAERTGDRDLAAYWYRFVTDVWRNADPELKRHVTEARAGLQRVSR